MDAKSCSKCGLLKPLYEFHSDSRSKDGKRSNCKECQNQQMRSIYSSLEYKEARREHFQKPEVKQAERERRQSRPPEAKQRELQRQREYRQIPEVRQRIRDSNRQRSQTTEYKEKRRKFEQSPQHKLYKQRYHASERGKAALATGKAHRRAIIAGCYSEPLPPDYMEALIAKQRGRCIYCRVRLVKSSHHRDHIFPLFLGGPDIFENLQLLCPSCNKRKQHKNPIDFALSLGLRKLANEHRKLIKWMNEKGFIRDMIQFTN